jgi:NADH dehydrogenase
VAGTKQQHVVVVGGGFGGLYLTQALADVPVRITLIDRRNFHLFQPLLYQVATGGLSADDIASPLRAVFQQQANVEVIAAEACDLDPERRVLLLRDGEIAYDTLVIATGGSHHYFGHDEWAERAPGLKTIEDAMEIRRRVFLAFESAERETDPVVRRALMTFIVVGGGPTGVELAGALGELSNHTLRRDFRHIDPCSAQILLLEGLDRILPPYPPDLSRKAAAQLYRLGVTVRPNTLVTGIDGDTVTVKSDGHIEQLQARTILWAAGMRASPLGRVLHERLGAELDRAGRVVVNADMSVADDPNVFVIGDLANYAHTPDGQPLPGVATVAMQSGGYVAQVIQHRLAGSQPAAFHYVDKGSLAVIGRNAAVADIGRLHLSGYPAWVIWVLVHINYLIGFDRQSVVLIRWAWNYFTRNRGSRLIVESEPVNLVNPKRKVASNDHIPANTTRAQPDSADAAAAAGTGRSVDTPHHPR